MDNSSQQSQQEIMVNGEMEYGYSTLQEQPSQVPQYKPPVRNGDRQAPLHHVTFQPKLVERSNIIKMTHLSKEEILERLEQERLQRLERAASNLKADMLASQRCPLCTLQLPCKHFDNQEQLYNQRGKLFKKSEWSLLSSDNRNSIIKLKLDLQRKVRENRLCVNTEILQSSVRNNESAMSQNEQNDREGELIVEENEQVAQLSQKTIKEVVEKDSKRSRSYLGSQKRNSGSPTNISIKHSQASNSQAAENFLLKVKINALKNKIGFRRLTMDQRAELEDRIQQEYFNFHYDLGNGEEQTALERQIEQQELQDAEQLRLRTQLHPWHGKSKQARKEYIEQLLIKFKTGQMTKESAENEKLMMDLKAKTPRRNQMKNSLAQTQRMSKSAAQKTRANKKSTTITKHILQNDYMTNQTNMGLNQWDVQEIHR